MQSQKGRLCCKKAKLKSRFGITLEDNERLMRNGCAFAFLGNCRGELGIDHDHAKRKGEPGFIRGILCKGHNTTLAKLGDAHEPISKVLKYVSGNRKS